MVLKIAITGNIASGKSQVESIIKNCGFPVYDSDIIAHDILDKITDFYGYDVFTNGKIDRKKLGDLVFSNSDLKRKLEDLVHPKVKSKIIELFEKHKSDKVIFVSVPLLYEAGFEDIFDKVLMITVDESIQIKRLMNRNKISYEEALLRINAQIPQEKKIEKADFVISNNGTVEELNNQVQKFLEIVSY